MSGVPTIAKALVLAALTAASARAQAPGPGSSPSSRLPSRAAGRADLDARSMVWSGRLGVSAAPASSVSGRPAIFAATAAAGIRHRAPGVALMIVGGAGVLTGILLDEAIISFAGAGVGLYGLYLYVR